MSYSKVKSFLFVFTIIALQGCGVNIFNYVSWSSTDVSKLRERECSNNILKPMRTQSSNTDSNCECMINKIRNKYSSLKDLDSALNDPNKAKEYRDFIESEVITQCNRGSGYPTPTPVFQNN